MDLKNWKLDTDGDNLAWLWFDRAGSATNTFSREALQELGQIADHLKAMPPKGLAILSAKENGFAAGADIEEFTRLASAEEAMSFIRLGNEVFDKIAALPFPTLALVHGFCMGGGTELALACRYRVLDDGPKTRMGLPEVMLGIVPGWGGMVRMPPLIGAANALDLMLTGRSVDGRRAYKLGLADAVTPQRHFANAGRAILLAPPPPHRPPLAAAITNWPVVRNFVASRSEKKVAEKVRRDQYPAPYAIIDLWKNFEGDPRKVPDDHPSSMRHVFEHPTARNLIRLFTLQERLKGFGKQEGVEPIRHLHVIGAGAMGGDIAAWAAFKGITVTLQDLAPERIAPAVKRAAELYKRRLKQPHLARDAMDRLIPDVAGNGVMRADLIIEAIVENADIKRKLYASLEPRMKESAILASNTSSIPLQDLATVLKRPERLVGIHFFNPVAQMLLVEIVEGPQTSPETMKAALAFTKQIDKLPLPCKSAPGFLVNRILSPYLLEAMLMLDEGISGETIDAAAKDFGMPTGPIELADFVGLDIAGRRGARAREARHAHPEEAHGKHRREELRDEDGEGVLHVGEGQGREGRSRRGGRSQGARRPHGAAGAQRSRRVHARAHRRRRRPLRRRHGVRHRLRAAPWRAHGRDSQRAARTNCCVSWRN
jgi:3-hydroxyacyl-CoA dehydrogenase/enoyl-CoA hydratase/3-hydroxybutyryl-CoA epimerase